MIINTIVDMGGSTTPSEITDYIFKKKKNRIELYHHDLSGKEKDRLTRKNAISLRAVKGHLDSLLSEGLVTRSKGGVYSINDSADYRYFGRRFGRGTLSLLMQAYDCRHTLQGNTEALVSIFGTCVLYTFLEACKAYKLTDQATDDDMATADKRVYSWVQDVLNPSDMFACFLEIMDFHINRHFAFEAYKSKCSNQSIKEGGLEMDLKEDENEYLYTPIDEKIINHMLRIISKKYPEYYEALNIARERVLLEVKRGYLNRRSGLSAPRDRSAVGRNRFLAA